MMPSFIGKPLKECIEFCNNNNIKYSVEYNSLTKIDEKLLTAFVVKVTTIKKNEVKIVASKFKLEV